MSLWLPDSTVLIGFGRGRRRESEWLQMMLNSAETVLACPVTIAECYAGARPAERRGWEELFAAMAYEPLLPSDAAQSGIYRYDFARRGLQLALGDSLIAAVARRVGATIVTHNTKDFPMPDILIETLPEA